MTAEFGKDCEGREGLRIFGNYTSTRDWLALSSSMIKSSEAETRGFVEAVITCATPPLGPLVDREDAWDSSSNAGQWQCPAEIVPFVS